MIETEKQELRSILIYRMMMFVVFIAMLILGVLMYWSLKPYNIITLNTEHMKVLTPIVETGGYVTLELDYCKHIEMEGVVNRELIDGFIYHYPEHYSSVPVGCRKISGTVEIPENVEAGEYYIKDTVIYHPNPLRTVRETMTSDKFTVK